MGVISLTGSAQAAYIEQLLLERLGPEEMARRRLICGNAYSFQGDERDVMFLSLVVAPVSKSGEPTSHRAQTGKSARQRFNVAASRARDQVWLFHSLSLDELTNPEDVRRSLVEYYHHPPNNPLDGIDIDVGNLELRSERAHRNQERPPHPFRSWFEVDVYLQIHHRGYSVQSNVVFANREIDLVIQGSQGQLAVEVDGDVFHGLEQYQDDLARQRQLERAGWIFWRIRESEYRLDPQVALKPLWKLLTDLQIYPIGQEPPRPTPQSDPIKAVEPFRTLPLVSESSPDDRPGPTLSSQEPHSGRYQSQGGSAYAELMEPYEVWEAERVPDPRSAKIPSVAAGLLSIIRAEGPMLAHLAFRRYALACGIKRVRASLNERFNKALQLAVRNGQVLASDEYDKSDWDQMIVRHPDAPEVRVRTTGSRSFPEIPPSEVQALMKLISPTLGGADREEMLRAVCACYGLSRLRAATREALEAYYDRARIQ